MSTQSDGIVVALSDADVERLTERLKRYDKAVARGQTPSGFFGAEAAEAIRFALHVLAVGDLDRALDVGAP